MRIDVERYSKKEMTERALIPVKTFERAELDKIKKQLYTTFMKSWDTEVGGEMTTKRFYSAFSHVKTVEDVKALRDLFRWCTANKKPFAPVAWEKYAMKYTK